MPKLENKNLSPIDKSKDADLQELKIILAEKETEIIRLNKAHAEEIKKKKQEIANLKTKIASKDAELRLIKSKRRGKHDLTPDIFTLNIIERKREAEYDKKIEKLEAELAEARNLDFTILAVHYLNATRKKDYTTRKKVKDNLHDIMNELKLHDSISKELQEKINAFDDIDVTPDKITINIADGGRYYENVGTQNINMNNNG